MNTDPLSIGHSPEGEATIETPRPAPRRGLHCIPAELMVLPQWVAWKYQKRGPKLTKVPYRASNPFAAAKADDPATWGTFSEASKAYANRDRTRVDGIGFVFSPDDPYCGIDLDNSIVDGQLQPWARPIIERLRDTYTEVSPSGTGVKIWVRATLPGTGTRKADFAGKGTGTAVEIYDRNRFFTTTGATTSLDVRTIADRSEYVSELYESIKAKPKKKVGPRPEYAADPNRPALILSDAELVAKARRAKNGDKFAQLWGGGGDKGSASENDMALCAMIAFWTGPDPDRIDRIFSASPRSQREKWVERPDYRERTIAAALDGMTEFYSPPAPVRLKVVAEETVEPSSDDKADPGQEAEGAKPVVERPTIVVTLEEHQVIDESVAALALDAEVYYRGPKLAEVLREPQPPSKAFRRETSGLRIATMEQPRIRDVLSRDAQYIQMVWDAEMKDFVPKRCPIPKWLPAAVAARGVWPGLRPITGIIETPILLPDGNILTEPGYDPVTGMFYSPSVRFPRVPDKPSLEDAKVAARKLLGIVQDFPFVDEAHKMAWLSSLLTPFARHAIDGPVPLHHFDANTRGIGKTMLADIDAAAYTGRGISRTAYTDDDNEFRKRITAIALEGDPLMLFDNIDTPFGGSSFDAALTARTWKDRILGVSGMTGELPLTTCFYSSGNNTVFKGDITRRMLMIRLETNLEEPDKRDDFKIKGDLVKYVQEHRPAIVASVLTIFRAHFVAGRPDGDLIPMGSYLDWSHIVRGAIYWATGVDPLDSTEYLKKTDQAAIGRASLIEAWSELPPRPGGYTALEALNFVREGKNENLRAILLEWSRNDDLPSPRTVGMKLTQLRGRVIGNKKFVGSDAGKNTTAWSVVTVDPGGTRGTRGTNSNPTHAKEGSEIERACVIEPTKITISDWSMVGNGPTSPTSPTAADFEVIEI